MCLIVLASRVIRSVPLFLAANREEVRTRPSAPPEIVREATGTQWLGGRDLIAGGTWLGVNPHGVLVAVTNRKDRPVPDNPSSRGLLCRELLACDSVESAAGTCRHWMTANDFAGFNLLVVSPTQGFVVEAGSKTVFHDLPAGLHVLTNAGLNIAGDRRGEHARREFEALLKQPPIEPADLARGATMLCGQSSDVPSQPNFCLAGGSHGTVSATVVALTAERTLAEFRSADGPPCNTPFWSYAAEFRRLLQAERPVSVHRINLKGPWDYEWKSGTLDGPASPAGRVTMPADWRSLFGEVSGYAQFRRRFNRPTNLTADDRVFVRFDAVGGTGPVSVNGVSIGELISSPVPQRFDITDALKPFNELHVALNHKCGPEPGGLFAPVAIVIETRSV